MVELFVESHSRAPRELWLDLDATDDPLHGHQEKTAYATIKGFEVMRGLRKGQASIFAIQGGIVDEARIVERAFGVGPCALTDAMA